VTKQGYNIFTMFIAFRVCGLRETFLADRTNGRAYATVLRLSVVVCDVIYCG